MEPAEETPIQPPTNQVRPKRRFRQFHLSTLVIAVLIASFSLWKNIEEHYAAGGHYFHGWPLVAVISKGDAITDYSIRNLLINIGTIIAFIMATAGAMEWVIHRLKRRNS